MVDKTIVSYVKTYLQKGYTASAIRDYLIKYGYNADDVDEAIRSSSEVKHVVHLGRSTLLAVAGISGAVIVAAVVIFAIFFMQNTPESLLDIKVSPISASVSPGLPLEFDLSLTNMGRGGRFDVELQYKIIDTGSNVVVMTSDETVAIETTLSKKSTIQLSSNTPSGDYLLKATANYDSKTATSSFSFKVAKPSDKPSCSDGKLNQGETGVDCGGPCGSCPSCSDGILNQGELGTDCEGPCPDSCSQCPANCDDDNPCTEDICSVATDFRCQHKMSLGCCGNGNCESGESASGCPHDCQKTPDDPFAGMDEWEMVGAIKNLAYSDPDRAARYCTQVIYETARNACYYNIAEVTADDSHCLLINNQRSSDNCYLNLAKIKKDYEICTKISSESRKDNCYIGYAWENQDFTICARIVNEQLRQSCESLALMPEYSDIANQIINKITVQTE